MNLDWLEVHCLEPVGIPHDAEFFRKVGLRVDERAYGTRVYKQMFTVCDQNGNPFVEVRRDPASVGIKGIHVPEECHLRLVNAACYYDNAARLLDMFLQTYDYEFCRISRVDICLDFERFDRGDVPAVFLRRYLQHRYSKINQGTIAAHGSDTWSGQVWNSISWGAATSPIGTKFYNKTLELYDATTNTYRKPHIRFAWLNAGLIDDFHAVTKHAADGSVYTPQIWRVGFSVRSAVKNWMTIELNGKRRAYQSIRNTLEMYFDRSQLLVLFASLSNHYFHFKYYEEGKRKDRCPDKVLFQFEGQQRTYKVGRPEVQRLIGESTLKPNTHDVLLKKLRLLRTSTNRKDVVEACQAIINYIEGINVKGDMRNPWNAEELFILRNALSIKSTGSETDVAVIMRELKELLRINDKTAIF